VKNTGSKTPVTTRILEWVLGVVPAEVHNPLRTAAATIVAEQDGFVRTGNRTAYNLDEDAFSSACIEPTKEGEVLVLSNMERRRPEDVIRTVLLHLAKGIFPAITAKSGKVTTQAAARERWAKDLGFENAPLAQKNGRRWQIITPKAGVDELVEAIRALVPERFEGTEFKPSTRVNVAFRLPSSLNSEVMLKALPDPRNPDMDAHVTVCLAWLRIVFAAGFQFHYRDENPSAVQREYLTRLAPKSEAAPAA
jgi:hypothetical protein